MKNPYREPGKIQEREEIDDNTKERLAIILFLSRVTLTILVLTLLAFVASVVFFPFALAVRK